MFFKPYEGSVTINSEDGAAIMERALSILILAGVKIEEVTPTSIRFAPPSMATPSIQRFRLWGSGTLELISEDTLRLKSEFNPCRLDRFRYWSIAIVWILVFGAFTIAVVVEVVKWILDLGTSDIAESVPPLVIGMIFFPLVAYITKRQFLAMKKRATSDFLHDLTLPVFKGVS